MTASDVRHPASASHVEFSTMRVVAADGVSLSVGAHPAAGDGPVVVVLHGLFSHMGWYRGLAGRLCDGGAAVYLADRRGAGISGGLRGHMPAWRLVVDDLLRVVHEIRSIHPGRRIHAVGISLGATISMAASMLHPELFASLILFSPGLASTFRVSLARKLRLLQRSITNPTRLYDLPFTDELLTDKPAWRKTLWDDPMRTRQVTARFLVETFRMQGFVRSNMTRLCLPVLALVAEKDLLVDNEVTLAALRRAACPRLRVDLFEGASHVLPACVPAEDMISRLWSWLRQRLPSAREEAVLSRVAPFPPEALVAELPPVLGTRSDP